AVVAQERSSRDFDSLGQSSNREESQRETRYRPEPLPSDGRQQDVSGRVIRTKQVDVRGTADRVLIALVETEQGNRQFVDLGKAKSLHNVRVRTGDEIRATGKSKQLGERRVIFADRVTIDGKSAIVDRQRRDSHDTRRA